MNASTVIAQFTENAQDDVNSANRDALREVANLRRDLDQIEAAILSGMNHPKTASGTPFAESTARDLVAALRGRDAAYANLSTLRSIASRMENQS